MHVVDKDIQVLIIIISSQMRKKLKDKRLLSSMKMITVSVCAVIFCSFTSFVFSATTVMLASPVIVI